MAEKENNSKSAAEKKNPVAKEIQPEIEQGERQGNLGALAAGLFPPPADNPTEKHASLLSNRQIPATQRQKAAVEIGKMGGNRYMQRVVQRMKDTSTPPRPPLVQRHASTPLEYEEDTIQRDVIQRHASTPLQYEENSIRTKRDPIIQRRTLTEKLNEAMDGWGTDEQAIFNAIATAPDDEKREVLRDPRLIARLRSELSRGEALRALTSLGGPLSLRIEVALDGLWADSTEIISMIHNLPPGQAAEKQDVLRNPRLMTRLRDRLSRADALSAMAELGAPLAERIRTAMDGWGVDVAAIEQMIAPASDPDKQAAVRDRALIDRLRNEISREQLLPILTTLGVSLIDRLNVAMDGWGVDAAAVIDISTNATDPQKTQVLGDAQTMARLSSELSREDALQVMGNLGLSLADRINTAMSGWGADSAAILAMIPNAPEAQRMAVLADTGTMSLMQSELSADDYRRVRQLLRFGSNEAVSAASAEELANIEAPRNLTGEISTQLDSGSPNVGQIFNAIATATDTGRETVRQNHSLLLRLAAVVDEAQMRQILTALGASIVDRLNLLLDQSAAAADILAVVNAAGNEDKQLILNNRPLLDRLLTTLDEVNARALLTALGDTLTNQLNQALINNAAITAVLNLITAANQTDRDAVKVNLELLTRLSEHYLALNFWKIRLHLEYGSPAGYPSGLATLVTTWEGDSSYDTIRRTIANLSTPDFDRIKDAPGIRDLLRSLISNDDQYMMLLRMLNQGLITEETGIGGSYNETLLVDIDPTPALNFQPRNFVGTRGFDVGYFRDKVQVEVRIKLDPKDDLAKTDLSRLKTLWEGMLEGAWDNKFRLRNTNHTLPIRINCNFTDSSPHHTVNVSSNPSPTWPAYNASNWYYNAANYSQWAPAHEFGHMLSNPDEYQLSRADYTTTVGQDPTTDPNAVTSAPDVSGTSHYTNPSIMGSNTPAGGGAGTGSLEPRHLNYFVNWINTNRRRNADGSFAEPAFVLV